MLTREEIRELLDERYGPLAEVARERHRRPVALRPAPDPQPAPAVPLPLAEERRLVDAIRRYQTSTNPIPTSTSTEESRAA